MAESQLQLEASLGADERATAVAYLAALQERLFGTLPTISLGQQLGEMRRAVACILCGLDVPPVRVSGDRPWTLAMLAEERAFERHYDAVTIALADVFTLKAHLSLEHLHTGFVAFVMGLKDLSQEPPDYQR